MLEEWAQWFPTLFFAIPTDFLSSFEADNDGVVTIIDEDRPFTYDAHRTSVTGSGALSVDTLLGQVVFGLSVTSHDLWMKCHLHETSRRRNGECGIDVVVAGSSYRHQAANGSRTTQNMLTAERAALTLVNLAKEHFPDSALAQACTFTDLQNEVTPREAIEVDMILQTRGLVDTAAGTELRGALELYLPKMVAFLQKPHTFAQISESFQKGNIYRQNAKQKREEPPLPA